jgi:methyltransferase
MVSARIATRLLVVGTVVERVAELVLCERHRRWALRRGAVESGRAHYPGMVLLHGGLLAGCARRAWRGAATAWPRVATMGGLVLAAQALRWWCIVTLGRQWNTRIVVIPGASRCRRGPYRRWRHPNYLAVVIEGAALPLAVGAGGIAAAFTAANGILLAVRIRAEERALSLLSHGDGDDRCSTC